MMMTLAELFVALIDQQEREQTTFEVQVAVAELTRLQLFVEVNRHRKTKISDPKQLITLPWEAEAKSREMSPEVMKKIMLHELTREQRMKERKKIERWKKSKHDISARK